MKLLSHTSLAIHESNLLQDMSGPAQSHLCLHSALNCTEITCIRTILCTTSIVQFPVSDLCAGLQQFCSCLRITSWDPLFAWASPRMGITSQKDTNSDLHTLHTHTLRSPLIHNPASSDLMSFCSSPPQVCARASSFFFLSDFEKCICSGNATRKPPSRCNCAFWMRKKMF